MAWWCGRRGGREGEREEEVEEEEEEGLSGTRADGEERGCG